MSLFYMIDKDTNIENSVIENLESDQINNDKEVDLDKENDKIQDLDKEKDVEKEKDLDKETVQFIRSSNFIRDISDTINNYTKFFTLKGFLYWNIHNAIIFCILFIIIFSNSVVHLLCILTIVSLDAFSIVVLHECPLTTLEKKYLGISSCDARNIVFKKMNFMYNCDHDYEKQIELLINVWSIIATKCLLILLLKTFHIKLFNYNELYTL